MPYHPIAPRPLVHGSHWPHLPAAPRQRGVALFVVIVFVMLSMLLALWASRTSLFNEMVVGNDAGYQRAFEAAQALLQDAELDIRGEMADGTLCAASPCRFYTNKLQFPATIDEFDKLIDHLAAEPNRCKDGLCTLRAGRQDFWNYAKADTPITPVADAAQGEVPLTDLMKVGVGARYGEYTGAQLGSSTSPANPILADRSADNRGGWYWIEVLRYKSLEEVKKDALIVNDTTSGQLPLHLDVYIVFRITAVAFGPKDTDAPSVVLQETYARQRRAD